MSNKKFIQLPHHHLSHSQRELWKSNPLHYAALYFDNRNEMRIENMGQTYGKIVASALEKARETGDLLTDSAMTLIPKYDTADQPITVDVKTKDGWLNLIAKPDTFDSQTYAFREDKTGKNAWTQTKAQNHPQMIFYAVVIWQKYGVMLEKAHLDWIETEKVDPYPLVVDGETVIVTIKPTGRVETFEVTFTPQQYLEELADMVRVAKEIEIAWASHITPEYLTTF